MHLTDWPGLLCGALLTLSGCVSTAGPFVTEIQADRQGNLIIKKCLVDHEFNGKHFTIETGPCNSFLLPLAELKRSPDTSPAAPVSVPERVETTDEAPEERP